MALEIIRVLVPAPPTAIRVITPGPGGPAGPVGPVGPTGPPGGQPLDATLTALAGLNTTPGLVEQTGTDTFAKRALGVSTTASVPTRADADLRYASLFSPVFTGTPQAPTADPGTNTTQLATTQFVTAAATVVTSSRQPADATLTALAGLSSAAGLIEQTAEDVFAKRILGVGATTSVPTRADADARYAALVHTHAISGVTDLQASLDAKAASVHTHLIADVSGLQLALDARQGLDATLTAVAALDSTMGLVEQTGPDAFAKRAIGIATSDSIPTLANADARYAAADTGISIADFGVAASGAAALTAALAATNRVLITPGTWIIDSAVTVGAGKTIVWAGGMLSSTNGSALAFNNNAGLDCPDRVQMFSGSIVVSNLRITHPEWWGALDSTSVTSNAAFQAALDAVRSEGLVELISATYAIDGTTPLTASKGQQLKGKGRVATTIFITTAASNFIKFTTVDYGGIEGLRLHNTNTPTSGTLIDCQQVNKIRLENIHVYGAWNVLNFAGLNNADVVDLYLRGFTFTGIYNYAILCRWAGEIRIEDGLINCAPGTATQGAMLFLDANAGIMCSNLDVVNSAGAGLSVTAAAGVVQLTNDFRWNKFTNCYFDDCGTAADLNCAETIDFVNCWFTSSGRLVHYATPGYGIRLRNTSRIGFTACVCSNNGEHGIRVDAGTSYFRWSGGEIAGNNYNASGAGGVSIAAGVKDFSITDTVIGNGFSWASTQAFGVQIVAGASDRYRVTQCDFRSLASNVIDGGTGVNKDVTTGNFTV